MAREDLPILNMSLPQHRKVLKGYIDSLEGIYRFEFTKVRDQRTLSQNAYMHGVCFPHIAKGLSDAWGEPVSADEAKSHMKDMFLRRARVNKKTGEVLSYHTESTANLNKPEGSQFIEDMIAFSLDKLKTPIPPASDYRERDELKKAG